MINQRGGDGAGIDTSTMFDTTPVLITELHQGDDAAIVESSMLGDSTDLINDQAPEPPVLNSKLLSGADQITGQPIAHAHEETMDRPVLDDMTLDSLLSRQLDDAILNRQEIRELLLTAGRDGITNDELDDLQSLQPSLPTYLNQETKQYESYLFNAVVGGNPANQWWTGGQSTRTTLGNLQAGSSQEHMTSLVNKWYGGLDRPSNFVEDQGRRTYFDYGTMNGSLFVDGINGYDINQGKAGTCYLLSSAIAIANNQPDIIQNNFVDNGDGTYGVRFYRHDNGQAIWTTVDNQVPTDDHSTSFASGNHSRTLQGETWVALLEKAYAQANEIGGFLRHTSLNGRNSYASIEGGQGEPLFHISGRPFQSIRLHPDNHVQRDAIIDLAQQGKNFYLGSNAHTTDVEGKVNFIPSHAYTMTGYNTDTETFTIMNPWGAENAYSDHNHTFTSTWKQLTESNPGARVFWLKD